MIFKKKEGEKVKREKKPKSKARRIIEWTLLGVFGAFFILVMAGQIDGMIHRSENFNQTLRFGVGSFVVQTDSMEPVYPVNTAIITYKEDPEVIYQRYLQYDILNADLEGRTLDKNIDVTFQNYENFIYERPTNYKYNQRVTDTAVITHRIFEIKVDLSLKKGEGRYLFYAHGINTKGVLSREAQYQVFTEQQLLGTVVVSSTFVGWVFNILSSPWGLLIFLLIPASYIVIVSVNDIFKTVKEPEEVKPEDGGSSGGDGALDSFSEEEKKRLKEELLEELLDEKAKDGK